MIGVEDEDKEIDKATKRTPFKPVPLSPAEEKRQQIRMKRLIRLELDHTGQEHFGEGDMIKVDKIGYGVIKWIGEIAGKISAGIDFVSEYVYHRGFLHVR